MLKLAKYLPIFLSDSPPHPHTVDFKQELKLIGLKPHPHYTVVKGERVRTEWYMNVSRNQFGILEYDEKIVQEDFEFTRNPLGFLLDRTHTLTWYNEDGSPHTEVKVDGLKQYEDYDQFAEARSRRHRVIENLKVDVVKWIIAGAGETYQQAIVLGTLFFVSVAQPVSLYVEAHAELLAQAIAASDNTVYTWLDATVEGETIRAKMLDAIDLFS